MNHILRRRLTRRFFSSPSHHEALTALADRLSPQVDFTTNSYELERHGKGEGYHPWLHRPEMVATPRTTAQVQAIIQYCMEHEIPIIPFGAGTSVEGHIAALRGGLSLDMSLFQDMALPDMTGDALPDPVARVGAGVTRKALNRALRETVGGSNSMR